MRRVADVLFVVAGLCAIANLFTRTDEQVLAFVFLASGVLYVIAPFSIIRHIVFRREVDRETMLGALAAYLLFGMAFAFGRPERLLARGSSSTKRQPQFELWVTTKDFGPEFSSAMK